MRKLRLDCDLPGTSPGWPSYHFDSMHSTDSAHAHAPKFFEDPNLLLNIQQSKDRMQKKGQVRPVRQTRARFRAQAQKVKICTQLLFTCGKNRQTNQNVSSIGYCPKLHLCNIQDSHIGSTHQVLTPRCFVDGPPVEYRERMPGEQMLNPPMRRQTGNMPCHIPIMFSCDIRPCVDAGIYNKIPNPSIP